MDILLLGSTGSIGRQTLDIVDAYPEEYRIDGLSVYSNTDLLYAQTLKYHPKRIAIVHEPSASKFISPYPDIRVYTGKQGLLQMCRESSADCAVIAIVGIAGLEAVIACIDEGMRIALANKEALVTGGALVMEKMNQRGDFIYPVDSEHSAIFQCLQGNRKADINKLILTCSGGPFRGKTREELADVTVDQALNHPNWFMGNKITIDSATLMNKGLEVIEAKWLFGMAEDRIEVVIHKNSVIHSMIEYLDGSVMAQMGSPDMRIPIQYALTHPRRLPSPAKRLNLLECGSLEFSAPDLTAFPCLKLAYQAARQGNGKTVALNAANEVAVDEFLHRRIEFLHIPTMVEEALDKMPDINETCLEEILELDRRTREYLLRV